MPVGPHDKLIDSKDIYQIEAFGTVQVNIITLEGNTHIELKNIVLVIDYIVNLVSLYLLNQSNMH
jgi:hypothetical protein